jgi:HEAT repeat protein
MELLAAIGPAAKPATDSLMAALADGDPAIAGDAAVAIAAIGPDAAAAVPELRKIIDAEDVPTGLRYSAAYALGRIGPAAKPAAARLRELAASDDELLATVATWATMKVEPEDRSLFDSAVPLLRKAIRGERELVRLEAAVALGDIGAAAVKAIPILELVSEEDPSSSVRSAAAAALAKIRAESGK